MSEAAEILHIAARLVSGDRAAQHGPKERNHQNIARLWNAYLINKFAPEWELSAHDIAMMMALLKIARTAAGAGKLNRDNYVDLAGYAGIAGEIALNDGKEIREE